jgi:hypothetical protein
VKYLKKQDRLKRLNPRNWIGYLVGYDSTNIYRIWNPKANRIVRIRDVILDEDRVFPRSLEQFKDELRDIELDDLQDLLNRMNLPPDQYRQQDTEGDEYMDENQFTFLPFYQPNEDLHPLNEEEAAETAGKALELADELELERMAYPTPQATPSSSYLAGTITQ